MNRIRFIPALVVTLCFFLPPSAPAEPTAADGVTVEFYLAESAPAAGLKEAEIEGVKDQRIYLHKQPLLAREDIVDAQPGLDSNRQPIVNLTFSKVGSEKMAKATSENISKRLAIVINGKVISAPRINSKISGLAQISGNFSKHEAEKLAQSIRPTDQNAP